MITIIISLTEYVCFVFCRLGGRVVLGNHYHHIVNVSMFVLYSVDSVVEWSYDNHYHHIVNGVCLFCIL